MFKKRKMKLSQRGIYIQDKELNDTTFKVGSHYTYITDIKSKRLIITGSDDETNNTVSKRATKQGLKPVIDIRNKDALNVFKGSDYLQIDIIEDKIIVKGYKNAEATFIDNAVYAATRLCKSRKLINLSEIIKVKETAEIVMSLKDLDIAVGSSQPSFNIENIYKNISNEQSINLSDVKNKLKNLEIPLKVISLFSGAGLLDRSFVDLGYEIIFATDFSKDACETYSKNIGNHIKTANILTLDLTEIPSAPILIGGTPCVRLSNSNRKSNLNKNLHKNERILDNPYNNLLKQYINIIKLDKECLVFIHENVGQLNTIGNGDLMSEIKKELSDFEITTGVLNSADFGSAQLRKRSILIGSKIGKIELPKPIIHAVRTVRMALEGLHDNIPNQLDYSIPKASTLQRIQSVPEGGNVYSIPLEIRPGSKHSDYFKRLEWDKSSITIVNPRKAMLIHPKEHRILSVRECARLQGLKDNFIFYGTLPNKQLQVCNGVPYELGYAIAKKVVALE
jgi:DNA (cytosine-5)-methyltransferase 1